MSFLAASMSTPNSSKTAKGFLQFVQPQSCVHLLSVFMQAQRLDKQPVLHLQLLGFLAATFSFFDAVKKHHMDTWCNRAVCTQGGWVLN